MPNKVIISLDQVTTEWLTSVLSNSNALSHGAVTAFDVDTGRGNWSTNASLSVQYTNGSQGALPQRLFLKMVSTGSKEEYFGSSEVTYYTNDYVDVEDAPLVHCYDAAYSEEKRRYHLLLDDLSETHFEAYNKTPTLEYGLALAEGFAAMHARWWGADRLAQMEASIHSAEHIRRFVDINSEPGVGHILNQYTAELEPHWPNAIRMLCAKLLQVIIERTRDDNGFTLIHGDAGSYNILVPRNGDRPIYILDRQPFDWSLTTWLGVYDLVFATVLPWEVEVRRRLEMPILRHYHEQLIKRGVTGYPWERLLDDYRLSVAMGVYIAIEYCSEGVNERWIRFGLPMLKRALTACDDLDCSELW